jgi:hypothetical protein
MNLVCTCFSFLFESPCISAYMLLTLQLNVRDLLAYLRKDRNMRRKQLIVYIAPVVTRPISYAPFMKEVKYYCLTNSTNFIISPSLGIRFY